MEESQKKRFINNKIYPISCRYGGKIMTIQPGEVVEGEEFQNFVDMRKGLIPYAGPRLSGTMTNVGGKTQTPGQIQKSEIPGIVLPKVDGAIATDKIPPSYTQDKYLGKTIQEWGEQAKKTNLSDLSKGQIVGLGHFLGLNILDSSSKQEAANIVMENLKSMVSKGK